MNKTGSIIVIEDDIDDQKNLEEIFKELNYTNEILFFEIELSLSINSNKTKNVSLFIRHCIMNDTAPAWQRINICQLHENINN